MAARAGAGRWKIRSVRANRCVAGRLPDPGASDIDHALDAFERDKLDSLLSVCEVEDYFNWRVGKDGPEPINYDYHDRRMRRQIEKRYLENGSFYIFIPSLLRKHKNRLGGRIGMHVMERHKMFQIDRPEESGCARPS